MSAVTPFWPRTISACSGQYRDGLDDDPYRLDQVNERLDLVQQLKRKYGETIEEILDFTEKCEAEIVHFENMDKTIAALLVEVQTLEKKMLAQAGQLSQKRRQTGREMEKAMAEELTSLSFDRAGFIVNWREV